MKTPIILEKVNSRTFNPSRVRKLNWNEPNLNTMAKFKDSRCIPEKSIFLANLVESDALIRESVDLGWPFELGLLVSPGFKKPATSKSYFLYTLLYKQPALIEERLRLTKSIKKYLRGNYGIFSNDYFSEIAKPKKSTFKSVSGVSRDKGRSILLKIANQFNKKGNQRTAIKHLSKSLILSNLYMKLDKNSTKFTKSYANLRQLGYLNAAYNNTPYPFTEAILNVVNNATPKFYIKKHVNKMAGKRKRARRGVPKLRSYLAFLEPHSRRVMSLKWIMQGLVKVPKKYKFSKRLFYFLINSVSNLSNKTYIARKSELYREVLAFLKRRR